MTTGDRATGAAEPSRRRAIAGLTGAAIVGGAAAWPWAERDIRAPAVPGGNGPLQWTAETELADVRFFGPVTSERLLLVERPFIARRRQRGSALSCLDAVTGRRLWSVPLAATFGTLRKVAVSDSVVLVRTRGALQALDLRTGRPLWRHGRLTPGSGAAMVTADAGLVLDSGKDENAAERTEPHAVVAYEPAGGRLRWTATVQPRVVTTYAPIHAAGLLLGAATTGRLSEKTAFVYALDAATGRQRWWRPVEPDYEVVPMMTLAYAQGTVFVSLDGRRLVALDAATGDVRWRSQFELRSERSAGSGDRAPTGADVPVVAGATAYLCGADGVLRAFDVRHGRQRWAFALGEGSSAMRSVPDRPRPIVEGDLVYALSRGTAATRHRSTMHVLGVADGRPRWQGPAQSSRGGPLMAGGALYLSDATAVTAHDPADGTVRRRLDLAALGVGGSRELITDGARLYVLAPSRLFALPLEG
ncbi:outer membrane protein assembly factor BamB family protein [Actinomadura sp. 3N407]|uniref:outer membrane protein assembly factor BamB family protein n=1 Tax=Actinomadura sp. 3N407 TaxID=3457423 RepID=UPI003FCC539B